MHWEGWSFEQLLAARIGQSGCFQLPHCLPDDLPSAADPEHGHHQRDDEIGQAVAGPQHQNPGTDHQQIVDRVIA